VLLAMSLQRGFAQGNGGDLVKQASPRKVAPMRCAD